ncbi:MAG: tetratricopeptide repeat protein [Euryarchaeota archaeon]|nr:tetratricopeptide repeat protein [Euryarchaeota archaeon]
MTPRQERELLEKYGIDAEKLSAEEVTQLLRKRATKQELEALKKRYAKKMSYCAQAEQAMAQGNFRRAQELLEYALSLGIYGNEAVYNLLGDLYAKKGEKQKAAEYYRKSGSTDSLKKLRSLH